MFVKDEGYDDGRSELKVLAPRPYKSRDGGCHCVLYPNPHITIVYVTFDARKQSNSHSLVFKDDDNRDLVCRL